MNFNTQITIPLSPLGKRPDDRKTTLLINADGDIICDNVPYVLPIPYTDTYVFGKMSGKYVLIDGKRDIESNTVTLDVPIKIMSHLKNLVCVGAENSECIAKENDAIKEWAKDCYFNVWCRTIFLLELDDYVKCYYVSTDKKIIELEGYPDLISEKYCRISHYDEKEGTEYEFIYKSEPDDPNLVRLLPNSNISYEDSYTIAIGSQISGMADVIYCVMIVYRTESHLFYGIFEQYSDRIPYSPSIAPNEFFSVNDELEIRKIVTNAPNMIVATNAEEKKNVIMLNGDMLFDIWVDDIVFDETSQKCIVMHENIFKTISFDFNFVGTHIKTSDKIYLQD